MQVSQIVVLLLFISLISCDSRKEKSGSQKKPGKNEMADLNKYMVQKDRERIINYIERKGLDMKESQSGLWYRIESEGSGDYYGDNDRIVMDYECFLLDGTKCYSSEESGQKDLILGKSEIESGLDQGLRMLKPGGKAMFILPPFLAFGLIGDGKKIPARSVLVYNISTLKTVDKRNDF